MKWFGKSVSEPRVPLRDLTGRVTCDSVKAGTANGMIRVNTQWEWEEMAGS